MKRTSIVLVFLLFMSIAASAQNVLPMPREPLPPIAILAPDSMITPYIVYPNALLTAYDVEYATQEAGEVSHTCATAPTSHSIWFAMMLQGGKLTLDTAGSSYDDGASTIDNTIISLYKVTGDITSVTFDNFVPVACASGNTGAGKIKKQVVTEGTYVVQISLEDTAFVPVAPSSVTLKATYKPSAPVAGDDISTARNMTFPFSNSIGSAVYATVAFDEPLDEEYGTDADGFDLGAYPGRSIWYKFTLNSETLISSSPVLPIASLFRMETSGALTSVSLISSDILGPQDFLVRLPAGNYYMRFALPAFQLPLDEISDDSMGTIGAMLPMIIYQFISPSNATFSQVADQEGMPTIVPNFDGWKALNASIGDELVCDLPELMDSCGYQMTSSGADEATTLKGVQKLSAVKLKKYDMLALIVSAQASSTAGSVRLILTLSDAAGKKVKFTMDGYSEPDGTIFLQASKIMPTALKPVKAVIKIVNTTTTAGETVIIDDVSVMPMRVSNPGRK